MAPTQVARRYGANAVPTYGQTQPKKKVGAYATPTYGQAAAQRKYVSGSEPQGRPLPLRRPPMSSTDVNMLGGYGVNSTQGDMQRIWEAQGMNMDDNFPGTFNVSGAGGGGGGGRGGGGGGGGGAAGMDQATFDAMLAALNRQPREFDAPDFQGTPLSPFSTAPWDTMRGAVDTALGQENAAIDTGYGNLANTLREGYVNPYANASFQGTPQVQNAYGNLMQMSGMGAGAGQDVIDAENAYSRTSDQGMGNLMALLGANANQSQASRMAQVGMDQNTARQGAGARAGAMRSAADIQQSQAQQAWQQRADDRAYQDNTMRQQWNREEGMGNQQVNNQWMQQQLGPLLELIGASGGAGLDLSGLMRMLQGGQ